MLYEIKNNNSFLINNPLFPNYMAILAAILDPVENRDMRIYLSSLFNEEEAKKNMARIDRLREMGCPTECENMGYIEKIKKLANKELNKGVPTLIINNYAGTKEKFNTLKDACDEYDLKYLNVKKYFSKKRTREIKYQGLIIKKLK